MSDNNTNNIEEISKTSSSQNEGATNLTLAHLNLMSSAILIAQKRGTFSLEESAALVEPVKLVSELIKKSNEQNKNTNTTTSETSIDNNAATNSTPSNNDPKLVVE